MKKLLLIPIAIIIALLIGGAAMADSSVVVTPSNPQGWSTSDTRIGGAVNTIADAHTGGGAGALQLTTDGTNAAKAQYLHSAPNVLLTAVTALSYQTKQNAGSPPAADPSFQLAVSLDGTGGNLTNLVFEPYWNGTPLVGTWQTWNVAAGSLWSSQSRTDPNHPACDVTGTAGGPPEYTLAGLQAVCPAAVVVGFGVNIGSYNPGYDVEADLVNFNGTTYDFEQDPAPTTGIVAVCATDSTNTPIVLDGDKAWVQANGGYIDYAGPVGASNCRESTFAAGASVETWVAKDGTYSQHQTVTVLAGQTVYANFYTTKVTLQYTGGIRYNTGYTYYFNGPSMEMFCNPDPITFLLNTGHGEAAVDVTLPCAATTGVEYNTAMATAHVTNSANAPLPGVSGAFYSGGWYYPSGVTDSNGNLGFAHSGAVTSVAMTYNGSRNQVDQNSTVNPVYVFQTRAVTVQLNDSNGHPLSGGDVYEYPAYWTSPAGTTDANGQVGLEMFSGAYSFAMVYNHTRQQMDGVTSNLVVFQTGNVNIHFSGSAQWYANAYYSLGSPQELLPGNLIVYLYGSSLGRCQDTIAITSGAHLNLSAVVATLSDSANHPQAGGVATAYVGGWQNVGTTDSTGTACALFNGALGNTAVSMSYGGTQQLTQNQPTNSIYAFHAGTVTLELRNSSNGLIDTGGASYYAGGWHDLGSTSGGKVAVTLLPGSYSFAMTYNGTREQKNAVAVVNGSTVTFQTSNVSVTLEDSSSAPLVGGASYYASGWRTIVGTNVEMLSGSYSFAMTYNGTRQQKNAQPVSGTSSSVGFKTILVTPTLVDHAGNPLSGGGASYYAGSWQAISGGAEMLPGAYSFAMTYNGTRQQLNGVDITTTTPAFQTSQVTSTSGNATAYYAGGWKPFTNGAELLPGSYTFGFSVGPNAIFAVAGTATTIS